jgi:hypothetical protein
VRRRPSSGSRNLRLKRARGKLWGALLSIVEAVAQTPSSAIHAEVDAF